MIYGYAYDMSSSLAYALSILPILGIGLIVTIEAAIAGFPLRWSSASFGACCVAAASGPSSATRRSWYSCSSGLRVVQPECLSLFALCR